MQYQDISTKVLKASSPIGSVLQHLNLLNDGRFRHLNSEILSNSGVNAELFKILKHKFYNNPLRYGFGYQDELTVIKKVSTDYFIGTVNGILYKTSDFSSFTTIPLPGYDPSKPFKITDISTYLTNVAFSTSDGSIYYSSNSGISFSLARQPDDIPLNSVEFTTTHIAACGNNATLCATLISSPTNWITYYPLFQGVGIDYNKLRFNGTDLYIVGSDSAILKYIPSTGYIIQVPLINRYPNLLRRDLYDIAFATQSGVNYIIIVGDRGTIFVSLVASPNYSDDFTQIFFNDKKNFRSVAYLSSPTSAFVLGGDGILSYIDLGSIQSSVSSANPIYISENDSTDFLKSGISFKSTIPHDTNNRFYSLGTGSELIESDYDSFKNTKKIKYFHLGSHNNSSFYGNNEIVITSDQGRLLQTPDSFTLNHYYISSNSGEINKVENTNILTGCYVNHLSSYLLVHEFGYSTHINLSSIPDWTSAFVFPSFIQKKDKIVKVAYNNFSRVVAIGRLGKIYTADTSLTTWTQRTSSTTEHLTDVKFIQDLNNIPGNNRFLISGPKGKLLISNDGLTYNLIQVNSSEVYTSILSDNVNKYLFAFSKNTITLTKDGINFELYPNEYGITQASSNNHLILLSDNKNFYISTDGLSCVKIFDLELDYLFDIDFGSRIKYKYHPNDTVTSITWIENLNLFAITMKYSGVLYLDIPYNLLTQFQLPDIPNYFVRAEY